MGVVAAAVALVAGLLAAAALGRGRRGGVAAGGRVVRGRRGVRWVVGLGFWPEEAVLEVSDLGLEPCEFVLEEGGALCSGLVHGLPVAGLLSGVEEGGVERARLTRQRSGVVPCGAVGQELGRWGHVVAGWEAAGGGGRVDSTPSCSTAELRQTTKSVGLKPAQTGQVRENRKFTIAAP